MTASFGIRSKILIGFSIISVLLIMAISTTMFFIANIETSAVRVVKVDMPIHNILVDLSNIVYESQLNLQSYLLTNNTEYKNQYEKSLATTTKLITSLEIYQPNLQQNGTLSQLNNVKSLLDQLKIAQTKLIDLASNGNKTMMNNFFTSVMIPLSNKVNAQMNEIDLSGNGVNGLLDNQAQQLTANAMSIITDLSMVKYVEYTLLILCLSLSIIISLLTSRNITLPLNRAIYTAKEIAKGERNIQIAITSNDEIGQLLTALNTMQESIKLSDEKLQRSEMHTREMFDDIVRSAQLFSAHSSKVSSGDLTQQLDIKEMSDSNVMVKLGVDLNQMTDNLSGITKEITASCNKMMFTLDEVKQSVDSQTTGASEQASSINQITASISEIEKSSAQTMDKAKTLGESAEQTRKKGQLGLEVVQQSMTGMQAVRDKVQLIALTILELSQKTQQVGEITAVVNHLAQQSKMLALNASIEAAKAGEAGKGFAVVAVEVKNLAEQSEQSTAQVQKILEDIRHATERAVLVTEEGTKKVDEGSSLVEQTGEMIRSLNDVIHDTSLASQQIEAAVRQESAGIEQITAGMNEINQVTATFVEAVKQNTVAMSNLADIAHNLKSKIDTYKT